MMSDKSSVRAIVIFLLLGLPSASARPAAGDPAAPAPDGWLRAPSVSIMTGFIYEPLKPYTVQHWMENLGNRFDADQWVQDFQEAGATHLVFYDKWIDGLVFHDTKTTNFKTKRDFVRELAAACQRRKLPLVLYFNALNDGNPEFYNWATVDKQGRPIVFSAQWPTRYHTLHSPFRQKALEQVRELMGNYGPIHGIWHDIFTERLNTSSPWVAQGYQVMFGEPFEKASGARLAEFEARTLAGYLDEVEAIRRQQGQGRCLFTSNGSGGQFLHGGVWADQVGARLHYLYQEGHSFAANDQWARMAWVLPKPLVINLLLNSSWFTPLTDAAPPSHLTEKQAVAAAAIVVCQGAGVELALTPGHSGVFGEDLRRAKAIGDWYRQVKPYVENARPYADVGVVLGTPAAVTPGLPAGNMFWRRHLGRQQNAWQGTLAVGDAMARCGAPNRVLYASAQGGSWPASLASLRAVVVPELATLDKAHLEQLRDYVRQGGRLIAFGHASMLAEKNQRRADYGLGDVLGVRLAGEADFQAAAAKATVRADSEYSADFAARVLVDGQGEAWASGDTPMPHWVELTLSKTVEVARLELVNRAGPYQVTDFEIEVFEANQWKRVKVVEKASASTISVPLSPAVRAQRLRVKVLRELYQGQDRQYADIAAVRVLDTDGHDWIGAGVRRVPVAFRDAALASAFGEPPMTLAPMAVRVEPTTAEVIASFPGSSPIPAIWRNRFGRGEAYLVTTGDGALANDDPCWGGLARIAAGEPTIVVSPEDSRRYRIIVTCVGGSHVLHVIDSQAGSSGSAPRQVEVSLLRSRLGEPRRAVLAGSGQPLPLVERSGRVWLTVQPDPVVTVVF